RDPRLLRLRKAEPEVEPERLRDLVMEEGSKRLPGYSTDDLADEESEGERLVAVPRPRLPERRLGRERARHQIPVEERGRGQGLADRRQSGLVREEHRDGDAVLPLLPELGPVADDRCVEVEETAGGEDVRAQRGGALGGGPHMRERVRLPELAGVR